METKTHGELQEGWSASEAFVRDHPMQTAWIAAGIGFLLAQLPARILAAGLIRGAVLLLKPVLVLYAVAKLIEGARRKELPQRPLGPDTL